MRFSVVSGDTEGATTTGEVQERLFHTKSITALKHVAQTICEIAIIRVS